jgi:hypothetical protein
VEGGSVKGSRRLIVAVAAVSAATLASTAFGVTSARACAGDCDYDNTHPKSYYVKLAQKSRCGLSGIVLNKRIYKVKVYLRTRNISCHLAKAWVDYWVDHADRSGNLSNIESGDELVDCWELTYSSDPGYECTNQKDSFRFMFFR